MASRVFLFLITALVAVALVEAGGIILAPDAAMAAPSDPCKGKKTDRPPECDGGGGGGGGGAVQTCEEVFGATSGPIGLCTCSFDVQTKNTTTSTPPSFAYTLQGDCETDTMLVVPVFGSLLGTGFTLTAVDGAAGFSGSAVLTNEGYRAVIQNLTVNIDTVAASACAGSLQAGILYSITNGTPPIDPLHPAVRLEVRNNVIKSEAGSGAVCRGIEATRTADPAAFVDRFIRVNGNEIWPDSYAETGILVRGFGPSDATGSEITASSNTVLQGTGGSATAMQIGPATANTVVMQKNLLAAAPGGAGLAVFGEASAPDLEISVVRNSVTGGMFGIVVDGNVAASDITGNSLTGDPANMGDIAICDDSLAPLDRRNKSTGYDIALGALDCSLAAVPAS